MSVVFYSDGNMKKDFMEVIGILKTNIKPSAIKTAVGNRAPQCIVFKD